MKIRVGAYVSGVAMGAVAAGIALWLLQPPLAPGNWSAVLFFVGVATVAQLLAYQLPHGASGSIAFIPFLASALIAPNTLTVFGVAAVQLTCELIRRHTPIKTLFNVAQAILAISTAALAFLWVGGSSLSYLRNALLIQTTTRLGLPLLVLVGTFFAVNSTVVSVVIALDHSEHVSRVWRQTSLSTMLYIVLCAPLVFFLGWMFVRSGPLAAAVVAVPLLGVRQLFVANMQLDRVNRELLQLMVKAIEARDPYTSGHSRRVAQYSIVISRAIGLKRRQIDRISTAALLHDIGKIHEIYAPILRKPDRLTPEEWEIIKTHPIKSADLVSSVSNLRDIVPALRHHHENWDGSGYPDGIAGHAIPLAARIIIFADTIDAMTSDRPYRRALGEAEVRAELIRCRGKQFDPEICDRLLASPLFVTLFDGEKAGGVTERAKLATPRGARNLRVASL